MRNSYDNDSTTPRFPAPSPEGVAALLASPYIEGIGKVFASRIVAELGADALDVIGQNPEALEKVKGLGPAKAASLVESLKNVKHDIAMLAFLYSCGLSDAEVEKIVGHYKKLAPKVVLHDPYGMVEDAWKLSFFTADKIGKGLGVAPDDPRRLRGALLTAVKIFAEMGNLYATETQALATAARITGVDAGKIEKQIPVLAEEGRLVVSHGGLYLPVYYKAEKEGAEKIAALIKSASDEPEPSEVIVADVDGHSLSPDQKEAIATVLRHPVTVITGGPGTGKTTAVGGLIEILEAQGKNVILAAPTGRAAKRISNLTGHEAKTLHRLLGHRPGDSYRIRNIKADILVIDEASMLEQVMFNHLLDALPKGTKVVLIGDVDQLPAIGAGDVLRDFIASGTVPVVRLSENFRQQTGSRIARNAIAINRGEMPELKGGEEFEIIVENTTRRIRDRIFRLVAEELPQSRHIDPRDIQVVTPQQEGPLGAKQLNVDIRELVNPIGPSLKKGTKTLRLGDRVMQTSNSAQRDTFNGETGWISAVDETTQTLQVTFYDGKISTYSRNELGELSLAYAITVHKLQGSETDYVIMPVTSTHARMLYRNLFYTAVSRARKLCILVGEEKALATAVQNASPAKRNSNFKTRLREHLGHHNHDHNHNHPPKLTA